MNVKTLIAAPILALGLPGLALAQGMSMSDMDSDSSGNLSMQEVQAQFPDVTEDTFSQMDADGNGSLSEEELTTAMDEGMIGGESGGSDSSMSDDGGSGGSDSSMSDDGG